HAVAAFDRQLFLNALVGQSPWQLDLERGLLSFGESQRWSIQVLGAESASSRTWLWAWASHTLRVPASLLRASLAVKAFGEQHGISELLSPRLRAGEHTGHTLSLLASGICKANAYFCAPHEHGAVFLLIADGSFPVCSEPALRRVATVFPQAVSVLELDNHKD